MAEPMKVVSLKELLDSPANYEGTTFIIDGVSISGEIKRRQAHPGYHIRLDPGNGVYAYQMVEWNGFFVSPSMAKKMMSDVPSPGKYMVRLTCKLERKNTWHGEIRQIDFYDNDGKIAKIIK